MFAHCGPLVSYGRLGLAAPRRSLPKAPRTPNPLRLAHQATETASQTTADLDTSFEEFNKLLADGVKQTDDLGNDVKELMKEHWDNITNFAPLIGLALFALTLFLFAAALVGGGAWLTCPGSQPPTRRRSPLQRPTRLLRPTLWARGP